MLIALFMIHQNFLETKILLQSLPQQKSVVELILRSGIFAKTILASLLVISIISWTITLMKYWQFKTVRGNFLKVINILRPNAEVNALYRSVVKDIGGAIGRIFEEGYITVTTSLESMRRNHAQLINQQNSADFETPEKNIQLRLQATTESEVSNLASGLPFLATAISVSPFLGLLGTVWGVMYTFLSIGHAGSAELSVVAPGIAEALITTITGLAVAIPALMCNNFLANRLTKIEDDFSRLNTELIIYFNHIWHREKTNITNDSGHQRNLAR